ncbi:MAG: class I SAM-dependent methyltransferase [Rhodospirillales bacterium]|nr:class I SAM-dependent methyltransferase [Rhodospirillales bacterium]
MREWIDPVGSDKHFWHRYEGVYRRWLGALGPVRRVVEFGVLDGASITWLRQLFPDAAITGVDIAPARPEWPTGPGIAYIRADQGDRTALAALPGEIDLAIEDGSHIPQHQAATLAAVLPKLRAGGLYILEDLHSALPEHPLARAHCPPGTPTALSLLLAIERARALGRALTQAEARALAAPGFFGADEVAMLERCIDRVELHRRASLPLRCWSCGSAALDPVALRCGCGTDLGLTGPDSLTAGIRVR